MINIKHLMYLFLLSSDVFAKHYMLQNHVYGHPNDMAEDTYYCSKDLCSVNFVNPNRVNSNILSLRNNTNITRIPDDILLHTLRNV